MVCCSLCGFESGFDLRVGVEVEVEVEVEREEWWWGRGVEMGVVEGEEGNDRERGGG